MNVLADTVRRLHDETDLIITSDVNAAAFRGINQTLFNRYRSDLDPVEHIDYGHDLLKVILLYTLDERRQEASVTECLLGTYKPEKTSVSKLDMSLGNLYGTAHYLDRDGSKQNYFITEDPKLTALVTREQERVLDGDRDEIEKKLVEVVRDDVWDGDVSVYPDEDISDSKEIEVVVLLDYLSNGALRNDLDDFFSGQTYQNTVLFVAPKQEIRGDDDIISKTARVLGAENLQGKVEDDQGELGKIIRDERRELRNELEGRFGNWIKWSEDPTGGVRMRKKSVVADIDDVKSKVGRDKTYVGEKILEEVEDTPNGISLESMVNDFRQFRKMPVILDRGVFTSALSKLYRDEKVVLEGDRGKFYAAHRNDPLPELDDGLTIHSPKNLDEGVYTKTESSSTGGETSSSGGTTSITANSGGSSGGQSTIGVSSGGSSSGGSEDGGGDGGSGPVATQTEETHVSLEGPTARVLRSHAESRLNADTDTVTHVDISYDVDDLSKEELIELIEALPSADHIEATVVIEREVQD